MLLEKSYLLVLDFSPLDSWMRAKETILFEPLYFVFSLLYQFTLYSNTIKIATWKWSCYHKKNLKYRVLAYW